MASEPIHIHDDSELTTVLEEATERPVRFERRGVVYSLTVETRIDSRDAYDPAALQQAINDVSGMFTVEEADDMIKKIYEYRRIGSRPVSRP